MPVNDPPFVDPIPTNGLVAPRGSFVWMKAQITLNGTTVVAPDPDSFLVAGLVKVFDPDGNLITSAWATNELDTDDDEDVYDDQHATYVGDIANPDNVGLFHDGLGNLAFKVQIPIDAELTFLSSTRRHKVRWEGFSKNGGPIAAFEETFVVAEPGVITFGNLLVTPEMITSGIFTRLTPDEIAQQSMEAGRWVRARLRGCRIDPVTAEKTIDERLTNALVFWARMLVFSRDSSAGYRVSAAQEGTKRVTFAGNSEDDRMNLERLAKEEMESYCGQYSPLKRVRAKVVRRRLPGERDGCC